jgi:hypothetical protein
MKTTMARGVVIVGIAFGIASCDKLLHREAPDANATTTATSAPSASPLAALDASSDEEEDDEGEASVATLPAAGVPKIDAGVCPLPIHPDYCRRRCRGFLERQGSMHARRVAAPTRAGTGKCGAFNVFAEDNTTGGIVEYFDATTNQLVGAVDRHIAGCNRFGTIPSCTPAITWGPPHTPSNVGLGTLPMPPRPLQK